MARFTKALRLTILFAAVGLITAAVAVYVTRSIHASYGRFIPLSRLADHVKNKTTSAHLWFEELLAGDEGVVFENDVMKNLTSSQSILQAAYDGKSTELGYFEKGDEQTRVLMKQSLVQLDNLITSARVRWEGRAATAQDTVVMSTASNEADDQFDEEFRKFQKSLDDLNNHVRVTSTRETSSLGLLSWLMVAVVILAFVFVIVLAFRNMSSAEKAAKERDKLFNEETSRVQMLTSFIESVSGGNYDVDLSHSSESEALTATLVTMRDKLKKNAEDDRKRNWSTSGLAQVGEILRTATSTSGELYDNIIKFVVKYTRSNQGGLFILNEDSDSERFLELCACYAFERKKYLTKKLEIGDGLVGQCFLEGQRIYILEVPSEYVLITSGLGGSNPNALLLVPLKVNEKIYGVLELASFNKYEEFEIELVEKLAESIASTISTVRVNETTRLLLERTQQQAEEMKSQEEEIHQNMEELEATQEEMRRKQSILEEELQESQQKEKQLAESQFTLQAIVDHFPGAIFWKDKNLRFLGCNKVFAKMMGASSPSELLGKSDLDLPSVPQSDAYRRDDLEVLKSGTPKLNIEDRKLSADGIEHWSLTSKVPIRNESNEVVALLGMVEDVTASKKKEADMAKKIEEREAAIKELMALKQLIEAGKA